MGILTREVEIKPSGKSIRYYKDKGYDAKWHEPLLVKVEDLSEWNKSEIEVLCDMCHKNKMMVAYEAYNRVVRNTGNYVCRECSYEKTAQTNEKKYGVRIASQSDIVKERSRQTSLKKYGVDNHAKLKEVRERMENTSLQKYGYPNPMQNPEVVKKMLVSNMEKYGTPYTSQLEEVKEKAAKTLHANGSTLTSRQQVYIYNLYNTYNNAELNYPVKSYNLDICLLEEKLDIEIDFGGHNLPVKLGKMSQEEFNQKEIIRSNIIKRAGYKQMRIISHTDRLPSDSILLQMLSEARTYFSSTSHTWITYDIDNSIMLNAENKDVGGVPYDFGKLRTIKETDVA